MQKNIQIDTELFMQIVDYFLKEHNETELFELQKNIEKGLNEKVDKIINHQLFSMYKKAPQGSAEREAYRKRYLENALINKDFQSEKEWFND